MTNELATKSERTIVEISSNEFTQAEKREFVEKIR